MQDDKNDGIANKEPLSDASSSKTLQIIGKSLTRMVKLILPTKSASEHIIIVW